jgi:methyl-accepting chemotaxis protein
MNDYVIMLLVCIGSIPPAAIILRLIFGKSIMFLVSLYTVLLVLFCAFLYFIIGKLGVKNVYWATPLAFTVGTMVYIYINSLLKKPLENSINQVKQISEGNLQIDVSESNMKNELGVLNNSIKNLIESLNGIVANISAGAEQVTTASVQLSSSSQEISQGANEQASSVEEVSSTMEEIASNIENNTTNAIETEKIALMVSDSIKQVNEASAESLQSVHEIAGKINIINDIALQTNILALNAAVEAARAGEHGKGFAVVAAEVRKLAERSKVAADEIVNLAAKSVKLTESAGNLMAKLMPEIEKTTKLVQEITAASQEQNNGSNQVNNAIQQLNQVTLSNASASEELATNAEELSSQAEQLKDLITFFRLADKKIA